MLIACSGQQTVESSCDVGELRPAAGMARTLFITAFAVLLFFAVAQIICLDAQETRKTRDLLFGIPLSGEAKALLVEVEAIFDKQVREEWLDEKDGMSGNSEVDSDGTPAIRINPAQGRKLDVIVHELYHFKLRAQGYPALVWSFPKNMDTEATQAAIKQLTEQLYDPILHYIFYPEVRAWGINPGEAFEERIKQALQDNSLAALFTSDQKAVRLFYYKIRLEVNDSALIHRIEDVLVRKQKQPGIEFGKRLSQIVINANPGSPEASIKPLVACLNILYEGEFHFNENPWISRQLGNHTQPGAIIAIEP